MGKVFKKILKWGLIVVMGLSLLLGAIVSFENWRGKWAWEKKVAEMRARGEPMTLEELRGPLPPEKDNFATFFKPFLKTSDGQYSDQEKAEEIKALSSQINNSPSPSLFTMNKGQKIDLKAWADYYRNGDETLQGKKLADADVVLEYQKKFLPVLEEFRQATARPTYCSLIDPSKTIIEQDVMYMMPMRSVMLVLSLHAAALIEKGDNKQAYEDTLAGFRAVNHCQNDLFLISHLINQAIFKNAVQPYWEGLDKHFWTEPQLLEFQKTLEEINFIKANHRALKGERILIASSIAEYKGADFKRLYQSGNENDSWSISIQNIVISLIPKAFFYQNGISQLEMYEQVYRMDDIKDEQFTFSELNLLQGSKDEDKMTMTKNPYRMLATPSILAISGTFKKTADSQILRDEVLVSVYLERYYLKHKEYPENLEQLVPEYVAEVPVDRYDGEPLRYQRLGKASYRLYSVGPNLKDDGGVRGQDKDQKDGDLVWEVGVN